MTDRKAHLDSLGGVALVLLWAWWRRIPLWQHDGALPGGLLAGALFAAAFAEGFMQPAIGPRQWIGDALGVLAAVLWRRRCSPSARPRSDQLRMRLTSEVVE